MSGATQPPPPPPQIVAIDFTKSNQWSGRKTFNGRSLHYLDPDNSVKNPYMIATEVIGKVLSVYDDDGLIPVFGFGDSTTLDRLVFPCGGAAALGAPATLRFSRAPTLSPFSNCSPSQLFPQPPGAWL